MSSNFGFQHPQDSSTDKFMHVGSNQNDQGGGQPEFNLGSRELDILLNLANNISNGISQRVDLQQRLLNFHIIFLGIFGALASQFPAFGERDLALPGLCIAPIVLLFFVWAHSNHDMMIIAQARYIHHHINPEIRKISNLEIYGFENFLSEYRSNRYNLLIVLGGEYNLAFLTCIVSIMAAARIAYGYEDSDQVILGINIALYRFLVILEFALLVVTIFIRIDIGRRYLNIPYN